MINTFKPKQTTSKTQTSVSSVAIGLLEIIPRDNEENTQLIKILLDSGSSGCLVSKKLSKKLHTNKTKKSTWSTKGGLFQTNKVAMVSFWFCELHPDKQITWEMHVDESNQLTDRYDIILGRDLLLTLGINLDFNNKEIQWNLARTSMKDPALFDPENKNKLEQEVFGMDPTEEEIIQRMTEQKYSPAELSQEVQKCSNLSNDQQDQLLQLLTKYQSHFDGTLGTWNTSPIQLELKEGTTP